jgi:hypothetical protein
LTGEGTCSLALFGTCSNIVYASVCTKPDGGAGIDEYVQKNGPGRNYGIQFTNGPDMRFTTLEDFYGDTGNSFRGAVGFNNREPDSNTSGIPPGFGAAVDDMVVNWKETRLDADSTTCGVGGECATIDSSSGLSYEGNSVVSLTVTDKTPYDAVNNKNDCNGNGSYGDAGDDQDCNNNGILDVTVKLTSEAEVAGEIAILDKVGSTPVYKGNFPYSTFYNSPGTLFIVQSGTTAPQVVAKYEDRNDGTGQRCANALEPSVRGFITSTTTVNATSGRVTVNSYSVKRVSVCVNNNAVQCVTDADCVAAGVGGTCSTAYGDDDGFADTNELCNLVVSFANKSGLDVEDLSATLGTDSPNIECITRSSTFIGVLLDRAVSNPALYPPFQFKVANINRSTLEQVLQAKFTVTVRSNKFDALTRATDITIDLDLSASGGGVANPNNRLYEDFEGGFGNFTREFPRCEQGEHRGVQRIPVPVQRPARLEHAERDERQLLPGLHVGPIHGRQ